jgi:hypothetical protein
VRKVMVLTEIVFLIDFYRHRSLPVSVSSRVFGVSVGGRSTRLLP